MSCIENKYDKQINVLTNEVQIFEQTNATQISHLPIYLCGKCVFNARYYCVKHTNYE